MKKIMIWLLAITATIFIAAGAIFWHIHSTVSEYENTFYPNVVIEGVNVSGLTLEEGQDKLNDIINAYNQVNVTITAGEQVFTKQLQELAVEFDLEKQIEDAFQYGKNKNLLEQYETIKNKQGQSYTLTYSPNETQLNNWVTEIAGDMKVSPVDATITIRNGAVNVTNDIKGQAIDEEQLTAALTDALSSNQKQDITVNADLEVISADHTYDTLNAVRNVIGTFTTNYSSDQANRNMNIKIATETIDSYLLMPGESFSFNDYVGDTTADKGYLPAGTYLNGEVVDSLGGGVCQVSTTLYNAIIKAGIVPDTRFNHSMTVGYVPFGHDAAIAYPYKDLAFTNPYNTPIYIEGTVTPSSVTFTIYSTADSKEANVEFKLNSNPPITEGQSMKVKTSVQKYRNGNLVETIKTYTDSYKLK